MNNILSSNKSIAGTIVIPIPLPHWIASVSTKTISLLWKEIADFSVANAPNETTTFGISHAQHRVNLLQLHEKTTPEKENYSIEFFHIAQIYTNQDIALAWSEHAICEEAKGLQTKFHKEQKNRYLYIMRYNVGRDRYLNPEGMLHEYFPLVIERAKTLTHRFLQALIKNFPEPPQAPSPIVM